MNLVIVVDFWLVERVTRSLRHLAEVTQDIARTGSLNRDVQVVGRDEVGQLVVAFNQMIASLREAESSLETYSQGLEDMVTERTSELQEAQARLVRQERLAVLGQLAGSLAHELRNPLGVIKNVTYLLRLSLQEPGPRTQEALDMLDQEVHTANQIIGTPLDYARTRAPDRQRIDLNEVVRRAVSQAQVPEGIYLDCWLDTEQPPLWADPDQLEQVLGNLLQNAVQAMPAGGRLSISTGYGDGHVEMWVADTGLGMANEALAHLFEPLFTTKLHGIGLGLALCKMLVEGHGGTIEVQSEQGKGSTFRVRLPLAGDENDDAST